MAQRVRFVEVAHNKAVIASFALLTHYILWSAEHDMSTIPGVIAFTSLLSGTIIAEYVCNPQVNGISDAVMATFALLAVYFGALLASVLIYRGFCHRMRRIPGPFLARFSKFYSVIVGVFSTNYQYFKLSDRLHEEYKTDVIRTGPREATVYSADAVPLIHGPMSRCSKGPWYSTAMHINGVSLQNTRDKQEHRDRRKTWDHAFNTKSLRDYEPRLNRYARTLMERLKEQAKEQSVRITDWANFYSFDVMGDVGFNRSFGMLEKGEEADIIKLLHSSMATFSIFGHLGWLLNMLTYTSAGAKDLIEHLKWTHEVLEERIKITPKENDIFSHLLDDDTDKVTKDMNADSRLLVVAGSDTTGATLGFIAYELCKSPMVQAKLRKIIDDVKPEKEFLDIDDVAHVPYLDAIINETLRLHPPVPSGVQRETPPEGITLPNGTYIPGNIIVWMPIHTMQRDPRYFEDPIKFMPERWTNERPQAVINKLAYMPFGYGVYSCVGQKLAMMELRSVVANWMRLFEFQFAAGEDGNDVINNSRDCFTTNIGKLDVTLTSRVKV